MCALKISPSILSGDFAALGATVEQVSESGADYIHVDIMDGHFVPNLTIGPPVIKRLAQFAGIPLDVHLMISNPDRYLKDYVDAGAGVLTVHAEACTHLHRTMGAIKELGARSGVSLNPATPPQVIDYLLIEPGLVDLVLVMSVNPGFAGQSFIPSSLDKIRYLRRRIEEQGLDTELEVDGGVKIDNVREVVEAGADVIVSGSGLFKAKGYDNLKDAVAALRSAGESLVV